MMDYTAFVWIHEFLHGSFVPVFVSAFHLGKQLTHTSLAILTRVQTAGVALFILTSTAPNFDKNK